MPEKEPKFPLDESGYRRPLLWAVVLYLFVLLVVVPVAQFGTAVASTALVFTNFSTIFAIGGALLLVGVPWVSAGWARRLRKRKAMEVPSPLVEIVHLWIAPNRPLALRVLVADRGGLSIHDSGSHSFVAWSLVSGIELVREGMFSEASIRVLMAESNGPPLRFSPVRRVFTLLRSYPSDMEKYIAELRLLLQQATSHHQ